jgi:thioredoxin reductase
MNSTIEANFDVAVVGGGPAGLNAALVLGRARRRVLLCDDGAPRNAAATEMHGFITRDGYSPQAIQAKGREELDRYPSIEVVDEAVLDIVRTNDFDVTLAGGRIVSAKRVLLATGMRDELPEIEGIGERWGHSVFVCPHCDGWEFCDRRIGIFGAPGDVVGLAQELRRWSSELTLLGVGVPELDRERAAWLAATGARAVAAKPSRLEGADRKLSSIVLDDGSRVECDVLFLCVALLQRSGLVARLGCSLTEAGSVAIDAWGRTSVPGVFACGDMVENVHQVIVAAASGVRAAVAVDDELVDEEIARVLEETAIRA